MEAAELDDVLFAISDLTGKKPAAAGARPYQPHNSSRPRPRPRLRPRPRPRPGPRTTRRVRSTGTSRLAPPSCGRSSMPPVFAPIRRRCPRRRGDPPPVDHQDEAPWQSLVARLVEVVLEVRAWAARAEGSRPKLHRSADGRCRPLSLVVTPGWRADCTQFKPVLEKIRVPRMGPGRPRKKPESLAEDNAYSNGPCREYLRQRGIRHTIPERTDSQAARLRKGSRGGRGICQRRRSLGAPVLPRAVPQVVRTVNRPALPGV